MLSRREFVGGVVGVGLAGVAGATLARGAGREVRADETFLDWKPAGPRAHVAFGFGGNALVVPGEGGCVLVDCKNAPIGAVLRREATALGGTIAGVINTHHHGDHTGGNHAFGDVETIAHERCTPRVLAQFNRYLSQMKEAAAQLEGRSGAAAQRVREEALALYKRSNEMKPPQFAPRTGVGDATTRTIAGVEIELTHLGPGHTDNDLVVRFPALNLIHTGDLLFHRAHPFIDRESGANVASWIANVERLAALCDERTIVVPGHGEVTTREGLIGQAAYLKAMRAHVARLRGEGRTRKEIGESDPGQFADYGNARFKALALLAISDELAAAEAPEKPASQPATPSR